MSDLLAAFLRPSAARRVTPEAVILLVAVGLLVGLGLLMGFSASFVRSTAETGDPFGVFRRQIIWALLGLIGMALAIRVDPQRWRPGSGHALIVGLFLIVVVLIPGVGVELGGARRWISLGAVTFQPSELLKILVPLYLAHVLARRWPRVRRGDLHALLMPALPLLAVIAVLVVLQPDLETALLLVAIGGVILFTAGLPVRLLVLGGGIVAAFATLAITQVGFRMARISAWIDPAADPTNSGYQSMQGFLALGSGGWLGAGLGQGRGKWLFLPNADTDFIFAIIGEELGLFGALGVLLLYLAIAIAGQRTARYAADPFGRLLAVGVTAWILLQASMNIASVVGLIPVTGVTLPLVSVGGTSLVVTMTGLGLLIAVARTIGRPAPARSSEDRKGARR